MSGAALAHRQGDYAPWAQLAGESTPAFHAFTHFRSLGEARSQEAAYRQHAAECLKKQIARRARAVPGTWGAWSVKHGWVERAIAWDRELDGSKLEGVRAEVIAMGRRQALLAAENQEALAMPARALLRALKSHPGVVDSLVGMSESPAFLLGLLEFVKQAATAIPALAKMEREALGVQDILEERSEEEHTLKVTVEVVYEDTSPM